MKKLLCLLALCGIGFADNMKISKRWKELNLYVFENSYVVKTDRFVPGYWTGWKMPVNMNCFYNMDQWKPRFYYSYREKVGEEITTYRTDTLLTDEFGNQYLSPVYYDKKTPKYATKRSYNEYTLTPIGVVVDSKHLNLNEFNEFARDFGDQKLLSKYTSVYFNRDIFKRKKFTDSRDFVKKDEQQTLVWLAEKFSHLDKRMKHKIYLIYDKNNTDELVAVLAQAKVGLTTVDSITYLREKEIEIESVPAE